MRWDVFISHDPDDAGAAARLRYLLDEELRLNVMVEAADAAPADDEAAMVGERLRGRGATFAVMTRHGDRAAWLAATVARARARGHRLIAVAFDDAGALHAVVDPDLNRHHFLDARCSDADLIFALWRCLYASLMIAA